MKPIRQLPAGDPRTEHGQQRRSDDDAQGIGADGVTGGRRIDAQVIGEVGQNAHRGEFSRADREPAHGEGRQDQSHGLGSGRLRFRDVGMRGVELRRDVRGHEKSCRQRIAALQNSEAGCRINRNPPRY
jgi:hypothetical protein